MHLQAPQMADHLVNGIYDSLLLVSNQFEWVNRLKVIWAAYVEGVERELFV
jgi:hypothetical protein